MLCLLRSGDSGAPEATETRGMATPERSRAGHVDLVSRLRNGELRLVEAPAWSGPRPTGRELEVLELVADGCESKEIAERLHVSEETVRTHVQNQRLKLVARSRAHAVAVAFRFGLLR